ncbi:MAG: hypothetical protein DELT_01275 [Desulfovibrio sp.]
MRMVYRAIICVAVLVAVTVVLPQGASAQNREKKVTQKVETLPPVQLQHWKNSSDGERYAFLIGVLSMMDMERAWQGKKPLPVAQSTNGTWVRGLSNTSLKDINNALDAYIAAHPSEMERPVLEVLGKIYVRPKLSKAERSEAAARYEKVKTEWESQ